MKEVTDETFSVVVLGSAVTCLVDFWAPWCGPCLALAPTLEALSTEYQDKVDIVKCNIDENMEQATAFGVRSVPCLIMFKDGKPVGRLVGAQPKAKIQSFIEENV